MFFDEDMSHGSYISINDTGIMAHDHTRHEKEYPWKMI